ncbi:PREDICTED: uncharacterized protein LOC109474480 [Branchiostoma belcheri]|uniref:Uncharacterized protein LOC109474480 n=1 Tax=Branchiostoma belcheri TaxID=7741 RepID=A0A6P4Z8X0_BRABE|nr:PREDICTED: uncharacterized protein LOC109474480 [Branchiostoma belcheri]
MVLRFEYLLVGILTVWMLQTSIEVGATETLHNSVQGRLETLLQKIRKRGENDACNGTVANAAESNDSRRNLTCTGKDTPLPSSKNLLGDSKKTQSRQKAKTRNSSKDNSYDLHMPTPISKKTALFLLILSATSPIVGLVFILSPCFDSNPSHRDQNGTGPRRLSSADDPDSTSAQIHIELATAGPQDNGQEAGKVEKQQSLEKVSCSSEETCMTPIADNGMTMANSNDK